MRKKNFDVTSLIVLLILDGWGVAPEGRGNAIAHSKTPEMDRLSKAYPTLVIPAAGEAVGLPRNWIGSSEEGHFALGMGRLHQHSLVRINRDIGSQAFFRNKALLEAVHHVKRFKSRLHLLGLLSSSGIHSYVDHLYALIDFAKRKKLTQVYLHLFLDGGDVSRNSARDFLVRLQERLNDVGVGEIASLHGRYYAMDRGFAWSRTKACYEALVSGTTQFKFYEPQAALDYFYKRHIYGEVIPPTLITKGKEKPVSLVAPNDAVIFFNLRRDRIRQLTAAFVLKNFDAFSRTRFVNNLKFITFIQPGKNMKVRVAWPPIPSRNSLAAVISKAGFKQLHIAETEKYAHITHFFNGNQEKSYPEEDRMLIPSLHIAHYDEQPAMSAAAITAYVLEAVNRQAYQFIVVNFANADIVGHMGNLKATIKAVETIDQQVGIIVDSVLAKNGVVIVTGDHGKAESLIKRNLKELRKEHSANPVPLILVHNGWEGKTLGWPDAPDGKLYLLSPSHLLTDIAPTILMLLGLKKPKEMTGQSLI